MARQLLRWRMVPAEAPFMKSRNFEFLRTKRPVLADRGGFAESYAYSDPASSLIKQRSFVEQAVVAIYESYRLRTPFSDKLNDLLVTEEFRQAVPLVVQNKLHAVRKAGNYAAHPRRPITDRMALENLLQLFEIAEWFYLQVEGGKRTDCPKYAGPAQEASGEAKAREALDKLRLAEAKHNELLKQLEEERQKRATAEQTAASSAEEFEHLKTEGQKVASTLQFDELTTRQRLIDQMLLEAGWDVGSNGKDTEQVRQDVRVSHHPADELFASLVHQAFVGERHT